MKTLLFHRTSLTQRSSSSFRTTEPKIQRAQSERYAHSTPKRNSVRKQKRAKIDAEFLRHVKGKGEDPYIGYYKETVLGVKPDRTQEEDSKKGSTKDEFSKKKKKSSSSSRDEDRKKTRVIDMDAQEESSEGARYDEIDEEEDDEARLRADRKARKLEKKRLKQELKELQEKTGEAPPKQYSAKGRWRYAQKQEKKMLQEKREKEREQLQRELRRPINGATPHSPLQIPYIRKPFKRDKQSQSEKKVLLQRTLIEFPRLSQELTYEILKLITVQLGKPIYTIKHDRARKLQAAAAKNQNQESPTPPEFANKETSHEKPDVDVVQIAKELNVIIGVNEVTKALHDNSLRLAMVCVDVNPQKVEHLVTLCTISKVPCCYLTKSNAFLGNLFERKSVLTVGFKYPEEGKPDVLKQLVEEITGKLLPPTVPSLRASNKIEGLMERYHRFIEAPPPSQENTELSIQTQLESTTVRESISDNRILHTETTTNEMTQSENQL